MSDSEVSSYATATSGADDSDLSSLDDDVPAAPASNPPSHPSPNTTALLDDLSDDVRPFPRPRAGHVRGARARATKGRAQRPSRQRMPVRQPKGSADLWWTITDAKWRTMEATRRGTISHIGHIMSDEFGVTPPAMCVHCADRPCPDPCRVYSDKAIEQHARLGDGCARCRFDGVACSFAETLRQLQVERAQQKVEQQRAKLEKRRARKGGDALPKEEHLGRDIVTREEHQALERRMTKLEGELDDLNRRIERQENDINRLGRLKRKRH